MMDARPRIRPGPRVWLVGAIVVALALAAVDLALGIAGFIEAMILAPLLASLRLSARLTAVAAAAAIALALLLALAVPDLDAGQRVAGFAVAAVGSGVAVGIARLREQREAASARLAAQHAVARVAAEATSLPDAGPRMLSAIGETLGWELGGLWEADHEAGALRRAASWHRPGDALADFERISAASRFGPGVGIPGLVWQTGEPLWVVDVREERAYPRSAAATAAGLCSAFAFPIRVGDRVVGVMEFFSRAPRTRDPDLLALMATVGSQIGQYIERVRAERAVREGRDRLGAILGNLVDGVVVRAPSGQAVYANDAAARVLGQPSAAELIAATGSPLALGLSMELYGEGGEPLSPHDLLVAQPPAGPGSGVERMARFHDRDTGGDRWVLVKTRPLPEPGGDLGAGLAIVVLEDVTEHKRNEAAQRFLAEAGRLFGASLDYATTLASVARLAVPSFADWCAVDIVDPDGSLTRVAVAHGDPGRLELAEELRRRSPDRADTGVGVGRVVRTGEPELHREVTRELLERLTRDEQRLAVLESMGIRSAIVVPMPGLGGTLGAISFISAESGRRFDEKDLAVAEEVGRRAATAIENARLYGERAYIARTLQESLLPPHLPEIPGVEVAARYRAAGEGIEVGGDFYDIFDLGDSRWAVVVGDVCGKGADAAATTALARYTLRAAAMRERRPSRVLGVLNEALLRQRDDRQFCTVAFAAVTPAAGGLELALACGGHPPPLIVRRGGAVEAARCRGTLLGVVRNAEIDEERIELAPGDALVFYTDGATEARLDGELFGEDRLAATVGAATGRSASEVARRIEGAVGRAELRDDLALVVLKVPERAAGRNGAGGTDEAVARPAADEGAPPDRGLGASIELRLPASAGSVRDAREAVDRLDVPLDPGRLEELRLLVSELVTNALRHGGPAEGDWIGLTLRRGEGRVFLEVSDPGPGFEAIVPERAPDRDGGWGLYLVERLATRWGVRRGERTSVWVELPLDEETART